MRKVKGKKGFIAIRIDLEKTYNRLDWKFIIDSLRDLGINEHFQNIFWHCLSSFTKDILWNGKRIGEFASLRGIRQRDPI